MKRHPIAILVSSLFAANAYAQAPAESSEWSGSASLGLRYNAINANDPSKFTEYRDLEEGANGMLGFELRQRGENDHLNAYGENLGRDDQYLDLSGGRYGSYKYRFYLDDLRHNLGSGPGARSPYSGIGSPVITATLPNLNVNTWDQFDHSYKRRDLGAMLEWQKASPWYVRADFNEVTRKGINVFAGANGTSPGNGFMDLPAPIDYTTRNYLAEAGYAGGRSHFAANFMVSNFDNGNETLTWTNRFFNGLDTTVLPPSNDLWRLGANGNIRRLPLDSTLAARFTYGKLTNDVQVRPTMLTTGAANPATNPNEANFKGDLRTTTFGLSLASRPLNKLDTRLYYNYYRLANNSTEMVFSPTVSTLQCGGTSCTPEHFHQKKSSFGAEAGYRVTPANKLQGGIEYTRNEVERPDFHKANETRWFGEWKNSSLDWLSARFRYQNLKRQSTFNDTNFEIFAANPMDLYVRRYDLANVHQNLYKLVFDVTPLPLLDIGLEAIVKRNDYYDTVLGRRDDSRQEYYVSIAYGDPKSFRVLTFGDIEYVKFDSNHRVGTGNADPSTPANSTTYNWQATNKDKSWQVGIGADWVPVSHFTLKASAIYAETNGTTDFSLQPGSGAPFPQAITNFDNTRRTSFVLRGIYELNKTWELTAGYSYERYRYSDIGYDNTKYVAGAGTSASYTTGQYAFQPYTANMVWGVAKYRF